MLLPEEPFLPPVEVEAVGQTMWYCYHCDQIRDTEPNARSHYSAHHRSADQERGYFGTRGEDYEIGSVVLLAQLKHRQWAEEVAVKFGKHLAAVRGPDDFVVEAECGDA